MCVYESSFRQMFHPSFILTSVHIVFTLTSSHTNFTSMSVHTNVHFDECPYKLSLRTTGDLNLLYSICTAHECGHVDVI